ncbi:hypothetical protein CMI37_33780 [Candidatus Pacearchaeota archaeon]|nr:hypothetical protein [Candidatus Pacearchaeota archaeon]|tara:strand:+ start:543 stop:731 length:189 start_codon:yes stop_codon:yes gene_type:complete
MHLTDEVKEWLDEKRANMKKDSWTIFPQFMEKFNLNKNEARDLIHCWDAEKRGIPEGKSRKF